MRGARVAAIATLALTATSGIAQGAALERAVPQVVRLLYEQGTYGEFGLSFVDPHQSGDGAVLPTPAGPLALPGDTGDLFQSHTSYFAAVKGDIGERLSYVVGFDQPHGVGDPLQPGHLRLGRPVLCRHPGQAAHLPVHRRPRLRRHRPGQALRRAARRARSTPRPPCRSSRDTRVDVDDNWGYGYLIGASYARPEIALRVGLTYSSAINHDVDATEDAAVIPSPDELDLQRRHAAVGDARLPDRRRPEDAGVRLGPLGQLGRFRDRAAALRADIAGIPLVDYQDDWWTYTLGVGRQLTPELAGSFFVAWEPPVGGTMTTLGPYDGRTTGTAALSYDYGKFNFTGALTYGVLGDTTNRFQTDFNDGWVWGAAFRVGYTF